MRFKKILTFIFLLLICVGVGFWLYWREVFIFDVNANARNDGSISGPYALFFSWDGENWISTDDSFFIMEAEKIFEEKGLRRAEQGEQPEIIVRIFFSSQEESNSSPDLFSWGKRYTHFTGKLDIAAFHAEAEGGKPLPGKELWRLSLSSFSRGRDPESHYAAMLLAAKEYIGKGSGETEEVWVMLESEGFLGFLSRPGGIVSRKLLPESQPAL